MDLCHSPPSTENFSELPDDGLIPGALYGRARQYIRQLTRDEAESLPDPRTLPAARRPKRNSPEAGQDTRTIETREARFLITQDRSFRLLAPTKEICECVTRRAHPIECRAPYFCRVCLKWRIAAAGGCRCGGFLQPAEWRRDPMTGTMLSDWREAAQKIQDPETLAPKEADERTAENADQEKPEDDEEGEEAEENDEDQEAEKGQPGANRGRRTNIQS